MLTKYNIVVQSSSKLGCSQPFHVHLYFPWYLTELPLKLTQTVDCTPSCLCSFWQETPPTHLFYLPVKFLPSFKAQLDSVNPKDSIDRIISFHQILIVLWTYLCKTCLHYLFVVCFHFNPKFFEKKGNVSFTRTSKYLTNINTGKYSSY